MPQDIYIPLGAALAIYARENGDGVLFEPEEAYEPSEQVEEQPIGFEKAVDKTDKPKKATKSTSHLRIVK